MKPNSYGYIKQNSVTGCGQQGFTLVEIMLAITLSLILIAGVIEVYLSSKTSFQVQNQLSRLQENQRISVEFLQRDIRQAGLTLPEQNPISKADRVVVVNDSNGDAEPGDSDSITIQYASFTDCLGQTVNGGIVTNIYSVDEVTKQLMCEGSGNLGNPQPIADGVANMQILLGENSLDNDSSNYAKQMPSADRYVNVDIANINQVVSVRIALLLQSEQEIRKQDQDQSYALLDTVVNMTDRFKRQVLTTTIPLRNP
jgi:type IV pilus assembly protein PilW